MHVNNAPGASSFQLHEGPRREWGPKELSWLQQQSPGCHPSVCAQCAKQTRGTAVPLHRRCTFSTCEAHQAHHAAEGAAHGEQAASLTFPGSCWADRAFLMLQFYAYTSKPHIQCTECLFMLNKWDPSCLHTCSKSLTYIAQLWSTL